MGCCRGNWLGWVLAGAVGALYWIGRQQRAPHRVPAITGIEEQGVVELYDRFSRLPQFRVLRKALIAHAVRGRQNARVLDLGCGSGLLDVQLAKRPEIREVVGIDLSTAQIELARARAERFGVNANFLVEDAAELPFPDNSFDLIISTLSMHHWADPIPVLREAHRVLVPGGSMMILDLRRDAPAIMLGAMTVVSRYIVPQQVRETGEPLASFQAAYKPWEAVLNACKAGWSEPRIYTGPFWQLLEAEKGQST